MIEPLLYKMLMILHIDILDPAWKIAVAYDIKYLWSEYINQ